jgi:hypothetical protein
MILLLNRWGLGWPRFIEEVDRGQQSVEKRRTRLEQSVAHYLSQPDTADRQIGPIALSLVAGRDPVALFARVFVHGLR